MDGWMDDGDGLNRIEVRASLPNPESRSRVRPGSALSPLALRTGTVKSISR